MEGGLQEFFGFELDFTERNAGFASPSAPLRRTAAPATAKSFGDGTADLIGGTRRAGHVRQDETLGLRFGQASNPAAVGGG